MSFADDLLEQAYHLLNKDGNAPKQASLRRAVSTAYYALFHLLIDEAVGKWGVEHQRSTLARTFEHGSMAKVCEESVKGFYIAKEPPALLPLKDVAQTFSELQQKRHIADYDNSTVWTKANAETWVSRPKALLTIGGQFVLFQRLRISCFIYSFQNSFQNLSRIGRSKRAAEGT